MVKENAETIRSEVAQQEILEAEVPKKRELLAWLKLC